MLYESRRILLGFRIKLNFDTSLNRENSYVFVNLSKTPTIRDLLDTIRERFEITQDVYITLNDCRLLNSEDNAVLVDVSEVRIVPCKNEKNVAPSKTAQEFVALVRDDSSVFTCPAQTDTKSECSDEVSERKKKLPKPVAQPSSNEAANISQNNGVSRTNEISDRKCRRFYSSIAETLRYLNENHKPVSANAVVLQNDVTPSESEDRNENNSNGVEERESVSNAEELCSRNNASFEDANDELVDKRKRKRKRKHSKKPKLESDQNEVSQNSQCVYSSVETDTVDSSSSKSARKHIFFDGKDYESVEFKEYPNEFNLSSNASSSTPLVDGKAQKFAPDVENVEINVIDENAMSDVTVTDGYCFKMAKCDEFEYKQAVPHVVCEPSAPIPFNPIQKSRYDTTRAQTTNVKYPATCERSAQPQSTPSSNGGFFSTFNSITNGQSTSRAKEITSESANPLATLLMCKQLQTPVEYNVQFSHFNGAPRNPSNAPRISRENSQTNANSSIIGQKSAVRFDKGATDIATATADDDDECEVLCQYKIVGDKVLLRDSNEMWNTLSEEEASVKLQPVDEPRENQSITFQMLYLGANMCPSMSDLICGKVISFQKDDGRLTLTILPAFLEKLVNCDEEDAGLPDGLEHVTENVYQISWFAVKNPRLLM